MRGTSLSDAAADSGITVGFVEADRMLARQASGGALGDFIDGLLGRAAPALFPTGLSHLDAAIGGGLRPRQLVVLAGPPGVGTSVLALTIARTAGIRGGVPTLYIGPDSEQDEVMTRIVGAEAKVSVTHLRSGRLNDAEVERISRARLKVGQAPLVLSTNWLHTGPQPVDVVIDDYAKSVNLGIVIVDCTPDERAIVRGLKVAAQQRDLTVVLSVQTPLRDEAAGPRPTMEDLAQVDGVADYADLVIGLHRPDMHGSGSMRAGEADVEILKHRYGPTGSLPPILFQGHYARFVDGVA